jgi:hypothetical protein
MHKAGAENEVLLSVEFCGVRFSPSYFARRATMRAFLFLVYVVTALLIPVAAQAMVITNVTQSNTVLFADNFEGAPAVSHSAAPDYSGAYDPVATTGTWSILDFAGPEGEYSPCIQVTDYGVPGTANGNNYLRIHRGDSSTGGDATAQYATQATTGDHIRASFMAYFPSYDTYAVMKWRGNTGPGDMQRAGARAGANGVVEDLNGAATALTYALNQWQEWSFDYVIGAGTYTMSVGGVSSGPISNSTRGGPGNLANLGIWNGGEAYSQFYIDGIGTIPAPEPSTLISLLTGMVGLLCYAWRRRKCVPS